MPEDMCTRRRFLKGAAAAGAAASVAAAPAASAAADRDGQPYRLFWGDLHNHNAVGYAKGSLQRSIDNAREHLDFFAFTGHAAWHDLPKMPGDRHMKWVNGFKVHAEHWPTTRRMIREANSEDFVALLGYEWHSSRFGDYCLVFPGDQPDLYLPDHVNKLLDFAERKGAAAIPHHVAYKRGWRGANFDYFRPSASPVVEIMSEHGCSERLEAPFPYIRHSMGGRDSANTIQRQLRRGLRFGFVASSDSHRAYPGAYGEGVAGVWARDLSPASLFEALRARRTYAATGDRIVLDVTLNGRPMGAELDAAADRELDVRVAGLDGINMVEVVRNGRVVQRRFPQDEAPPVRLPGRAKCRVQYGWGPWAALGLGRTCRWDMRLTISGGRFLNVWPCFQSGPFEEDLRDRLRLVSPAEISLRSYTSRVECFAQDPTKAIVVELEGGPDAVLTLKLARPVDQTTRARLGQLVEDNVVGFTGGFTSESYLVHRLVGPERCETSLRFVERRTTPAPGGDWYYVRVTEDNGQMAWSSPIWVG